MIPGRIRNADSYRDGQPDLDVFNPCFSGIVSPRFCGSDLDGLFAVSMVCHGIWERAGHFLIQEHKASPESWVRARGQWYALNALASSGSETVADVVAMVCRELMLDSTDAGRLADAARTSSLGARVTVIATYGVPNAPASYARLPVEGWQAGPCPHDPHPISLDDVESMPHRKWIRWVEERARR